MRFPNERITGQSVCVETASLSRAIDGLYEAFGGYERPAKFLACGCCWKGDIVPGARWRGTSRPVVEVVAPGGNQPLRTLPPDAALAEIVTDVPLTGGTVEIMKHYLPRLCEVATSIRFEDGDPYLPYVLSRLSDEPEVGGDPWWNWPPAEQAAVQEFLNALWFRDRRSSVEVAGETLCAIGLAAPDLRPYLSAWSMDPDPAALAILAAYRELNGDAVSSGSLDDVWWDDNYGPTQSNRAQLLAWLEGRGLVLDDE